jgi:hypothetical protein
MSSNIEYRRHTPLPETVTAVILSRFTVAAAVAAPVPKARVARVEVRIVRIVLIVRSVDFGRKVDRVS